MKRNYTFLYLYGISAVFVAVTVARKAIIGGDKAGVDQFPYQISLQSFGRHECGGGILDDFFVISAAHCVIDVDGKFFNLTTYILAGTVDLYKTYAPAVVNVVDKVYVPTEYVRHLSTGDIAVLKMKHSFKLSKHKNLKRLELPKSTYENCIGKAAKIAGFGWHWINVDSDNKEIGGINDTHLRYIDVDVLDHCHRNYLQRTNDDKQICARVRQCHHSATRGVCLTDSGGPLVYNEVVYGVLSASPLGCVETDVGAVYTRVAHYLNFIKHTMDDKHRKGKDIRVHELHSQL